MKILITGGSGFIGRAICQRLQRQQLTVLTRKPNQARQKLPTSVELITTIDAIDKVDVVINLAGAPIFRPWTSSYKKILWQSRVDFTHQLVAKLKTLAKPPKILISGSAVGYYGPHQDEILTEDAMPNAAFSHELCQAWEQAALALDSRVVCLRQGIVLGPGAIPLQAMKMALKLGLGAKLGSGNQWLSWVNLVDLVNIIEFCIGQPLVGPINACAPEPLPNAQFMQTYAQVLNRPRQLALPQCLFKPLGEMGQELLLTGQRVVPTALQASGFGFLYPTLLESLQAIEKSGNSL